MKYTPLAVDVFVKEMKEFVSQSGVEDKIKNPVFARLSDRNTLGLFITTQENFGLIYVNADYLFATDIPEETPYLIVRNRVFDSLYITVHHELGHAKDTFLFEERISEDKREEFALEMLSSINNNYYKEFYTSFYFENKVQLESVVKFVEYAKSKGFSEKRTNSAVEHHFQIKKAIKQDYKFNHATNPDYKKQTAVDYAKNILTCLIEDPSLGEPDFQDSKSMYFPIMKDFNEPLSSATDIFNETIKVLDLDNYYFSLDRKDRMYFMSSLSLCYNEIVKRFQPELAMNKELLDTFLEKGNLQHQKLSLQYHLDKAFERNLTSLHVNLEETLENGREFFLNILDFQQRNQTISSKNIEPEIEPGA